jgi:tetratricopeptide (TPR) repeat protein
MKKRLNGSLCLHGFKKVMDMKKWVLLILLFAAQPLYAMNEQQFVQMIGQFQQAVEGNEQARDQVKHLLEQILAQDENDPLALVYYGSTLTLEGRDAWMPWNKMKLTEKGMDIMEKALKMSRGITETPVYLKRSIEMEVLMSCAITFTQVPKMFGRFEQGVDLLDEITNDPRYQQFNSEQKASYLYYRGMAAINMQHTKDARVYLQQSIDLNADPQINTRAAEALKGL